MTPEQERKMADALGDGSDWPAFTNDPEVNYEIDRRVSDPEMLPWSEASQEDRDTYIEEVKLQETMAMQVVIINL